MFKNWSKLSHMMKKLYNPVEYDMAPYKRTLEEINGISLNEISDSELKALSEKLKKQAQAGTPLDVILAEAFALVREVSKRLLGMYPYDVQVMAGIALHRGKMVEMQTGEGKTLTAVMPAYLNALSGQGAHVLTFNDYLACRDAEWMGPVYKFLGLTVGYVKEGMSIVDRQKAYASDITYVTAKEAGFDYLRDFLCNKKELLVHRPFHYAIVDEADSILIDEARVPPVIAGDIPEENDQSHCLAELVKKLKQGVDFAIDGYGDHIHLTDTGILHAEEMLGCGNLYDTENMRLLAGLNCALHAEMLLQRDKDYIVRNSKIEIVDALTGRIADKRHWPDLLHGAVEAKEGLKNEVQGRIMGSLCHRDQLP